MPESTIPIPGRFLQKVVARIERTGLPPLRRRRTSDRYTITARADSAGGFELVLHDYRYVDASLFSTYGQLAAHIGMDVIEMLDVLAGDDFQELPDVDDLLDPYRTRYVEGAAAVENAAEVFGALPLEEPNDALELLLDHLPGPELAPLLAGTIGRDFEATPATASPGQLPAGSAGAGRELRLGGVQEAVVGRGRGSRTEHRVPSAASLTCLQHVLDRLGRGVWIRGGWRDPRCVASWESEDLNMASSWTDTVMVIWYPRGDWSVVANKQVDGENMEIEEHTRIRTPKEFVEAVFDCGSAVDMDLGYVEIKERLDAIAGADAQFARLLREYLDSDEL
jgi:hypothetical protein